MGRLLQTSPNHLTAIEQFDHTRARISRDICSREFATSISGDTVSPTGIRAILVYGALARKKIPPDDAGGDETIPS
jgi:hypothetical protein